MSRTAEVKDEKLVPGVVTSQRVFQIIVPKDSNDAVAKAEKDLVFIDEFYQTIDCAELYTHAQNSARVLASEQSLAKMFVAPIEKVDGRYKLKFVFVIAHQIADGLATYTWLRHFLTLLNLPISELKSRLSEVVKQDSIQRYLPHAQEDLYPPVSGSRARQRWFWTLNLVLRHVKIPQPAAFQNPLRRKISLQAAQPMSPKFPKLLDYSRMPPLNTFTIRAVLSPRATKRLHRLCREAGTSIGAGAFVLCAITMMYFYETNLPFIPESERLPFIGSFPINPRPFFSHVEAPDSLMLAFSDGVVLPFLPSSLPIEGRFRLLAKQAHRQLLRYQKRVRLQNQGRNDVDIGSRSPARILAMNYISIIERQKNLLPEHVRRSTTLSNPQGLLMPRPNPTMATCGVSSVGKSSWRQGEYNLSVELEAGEDGFVADFRNSLANVRARDGEFLVGIGGNAERISANVSYDGNAIDPEMAAKWQVVIEGLLEEDERANL